LHFCGSVESEWWHGGYGCLRAISEGGVWSSRVVVDAPLLDDDLRFPEAVKDLAIEAIVPELAVEGPAVAILSR